VIAPLPHHLVDDLVRRTLDEDLGAVGDLSSRAAIPAERISRATVVARAPGTIAGAAIAAAVFHAVDDRIDVHVEVQDGTRVDAGTVVLRLTGPSRGVLSAERSALNLLGHASGIATATRTAVDAVAGHRARIVDTRKTTPGLRALEKYAVRCGGGTNHRIGLFDAVMLKDNHLAASDSIGAAVAAVRADVGHTVHVEVEVDRLEQLDEALVAGADSILLDNFAPEQLRVAVERTAGRAILEASGGITPDAVAAVAASGVDVISLGWITHSAPRLDVALDLVPD
jgi:nicotinate-nucleotide pyrophosphorylase (carboxylating)